VYSEATQWLFSAALWQVQGGVSSIYKLHGGMNGIGLFILLVIILLASTSAGPCGCSYISFHLTKLFMVYKLCGIICWICSSLSFYNAHSLSKEVPLQNIYAWWCFRSKSTALSFNYMLCCFVQCTMSSFVIQLGGCTYHHNINSFSSSIICKLMVGCGWFVLVVYPGF